MKPKFKKGDRVQGVMGYEGCYLIRMAKGTVLEQLPAQGAEHSFYAVKFDEWIGGHSCGNRCKMGFGYHVPSTHLKKIRA